MGIFIEFSVKSFDRGGVSIIEASGYINDSGGKELRKVAQGICDQGTRQIIFDFSQCTLINSSGLANLVDFAGDFVEDMGGHLAFVTTNDNLISVFEIIRISRFVVISPTVEEALTELKNLKIQ